MKKNSIQNLLYRSYLFGNTWASGIFSGQCSVGNLPLLFKKIHPGLITSDYIIKSILTIFWVHFEKFLPLLHAPSFSHPLTNGGINLAFIFLTFIGVSSKFHELLLTTSLSFEPIVFR